MSDAFVELGPFHPEVAAVIEAARLSARLAPRVPDGNAFGHDWTIPNPVIETLRKFDKATKE